jgi:uncharacterized protein (UPF0335 family)
MSDENVSVNELREFVERIEKIEEKLDENKADRKAIYTELKDQGFDSKAVRQIVRLRKQDKSTRDMEQALIDTYKDALGL